MTKEVLRALFLEKRRTLSPEEFAHRNQLITLEFDSFLHKHADLQNVHLFYPILKQQEVDTRSLISLLHTREITTVLPRVKKGRRLSHHIYEKSDQLVPNQWGILEPSSTKTIEPGALDLVLVPLIAFDRKGNRIGYGGGFYDAFLKEVKKNCLKVGLSISPPLDNIDYIEKHDIRLDMCITHLRSYHF
jgi:5-formyltetrahydrofolate cyclo-ligase